MASERDKALGQIEQYVARIEVHLSMFFSSWNAVAQKCWGSNLCGKICYILNTSDFNFAQELESEVRHNGKLLVDKDRAIAEGKHAAHDLLEAQRQMSELEKRNDVLEKVNNCYDADIDMIHP